ncbi:hypothetical protein DVH05_005372 [Phytophthora capsici]|nr:hypothetical protein DVH05_005372 [Phytophthora capsici]
MDWDADRVSAVGMESAQASDGIVISATRVRTKCVSATLRCRNCSHTKRVAVSGMGGVSIPRVCDRNREEENPAPRDLCPKDSYMVLPDKGEYVDQQMLTKKVSCRRTRKWYRLVKCHVTWLLLKG